MQCFIYLFLSFADQIHFIDFEVAMYNYEHFDVAQHFCEYTGKYKLHGTLYCVNFLHRQSYIYPLTTNTGCHSFWKLLYDCGKIFNTLFK